MGRYRALRARGVRRIFGTAFNLTNGNLFAERAYVAALTNLIKIAASEPTDWFVAHAHGALPVAARAAKRLGAKIAFDCEDLLAEANDAASEVVKLIEGRYLSKCEYISVPSEAMAAELKRKYGDLAVVVLYNFFPIKLGNGMRVSPFPAEGNTIKLYWFSQTIGEGRGLEDALEAVGTIGDRAELHLRGKWASGYEEKFRKAAHTLKVNLHVHPVIDHDELIQQMKEFDIGLALEPLANHNAALTQSNKIGSYFLGGLAIAATDTPGQREVLGKRSRAGFLYPPGRPEVLAAELKRWLDNPDELRAAQQASWELGRNRYCWDIEQHKFFAALGIPVVSSRLGL
jgi:glycosyltransferase involved in cell wall biosynthesis